MPCEVLQPESYRHLIELLDGSGTANLLFHAETIDDETIRLLSDLPVALRRPALFAVNHRVHRLDGLTDGLRNLAFRAGAGTFDDLVADLGSGRPPAQFVAKLSRLRPSCLCLIRCPRRGSGRPVGLIGPQSVALSRSVGRTAWQHLPTT
jgi:hypothetical protein